MTYYLVTNIVDGDTFYVSPYWGYGGKYDQRVRIANFNAPEARTTSGIMATQKLRQIIWNKYVTLSPQAVDMFGRLIADVYLDNYDIKIWLQNQYV